MAYKLYKRAWVFDGECHASHRLEETEIKALLKEGGWLVKNTYDFDCVEETSYWYVIKDTFGGMEELSPKMRNQVKKSLKSYDVEKVSKAEFEIHALRIFNLALSSYKVKAKPLNESDFARASADWGDDTDFWMVYVKDTKDPVALAVNGVFDDSVQYWIMKADPQFLHNSTYPYYGLIYRMNEYYLQEEGKKYVSDGARSSTEHSNIQDFLISKFNFRRAYCCLQIDYLWWMRIAVKILFPFRILIKNQSIRAILNLEAISKGKI